MAESKLKDIIQTSLASIREVIDANTIIGEAIEVGNGTGTVIIPVSKVSMGYASGGVDYFGKNAPPSVDLSNFGGGGGTGVSINPVGFLVVKSDGSVEMLNVNAGSSDTGDAIAALIEKSPEWIAKVKSFFSKEKNEEQEKKRGADEEADE
ncbi:MAG: sporulation protein YtfJ [Clostridiales bacterium]|nr:sporulation protein YtfJ [Clostridiales bacterium]